MAYNVLPVYQTGLLAPLNIKLGNEPLRCIKRDKLLLKRSQFLKLLWVPMLTANMQGATYTSL